VAQCALPVGPKVFKHSAKCFEIDPTDACREVTGSDTQIHDLGELFTDCAECLAPPAAPSVCGDCTQTLPTTATLTFFGVDASVCGCMVCDDCGPTGWRGAGICDINVWCVKVDGDYDLTMNSNCNTTVSGCTIFSQQCVKDFPAGPCDPDGCGGFQNGGVCENLDGFGEIRLQLNGGAGAWEVTADIDISYKNSKRAFFATRAVNIDTCFNDFAVGNSLSCYCDSTGCATCTKTNAANGGTCEVVFT
tara:strand:+ start:774 stop:1517 length:744 start_codon:yes stop_codon:yes gene_type:complete